MLKKKSVNPVNSQTKKSAVGIIIATALVGLGTQEAKAQPKANVIGIDHIGINVPDLNQATTFFGDVLGFVPVTTLGPIPLDQNWKQANHMNEATGPVTIKMMNAGSGASIEIFAYQENHGSKVHPGGDDIGASHIAFYTSDINGAVSYLKSKGVQVLGDPFVMPSGDTQGESWVYFLTPWGSKLELVSYPEGKGYEKNSPKTLLWSPKNAGLNTRTISEEMSEKEVIAIIEKHLELWNGEDAVKRKAIMKEIYATDVEMVDRHFIAVGHDQVDKFIVDLHQKDPSFKFTHAKPIDAHHNIARMFWQVGSKENPAVVTGMDMFVIENGKVQKLYVFVDEKK